MNKKKLLLLSIGLFSLLAFTGIKTTLRQDKESEIVEKVAVVPGQKARDITFEVSKAFGVGGAQTLTVSVTPSSADIDLTFSSNKEQVIVTKTGPKTASVYVTTYFANYATLTVSDSISGLTATGKVYSYGQTSFTQAKLTTDGDSANTVNLSKSAMQDAFENFVDDEISSIPKTDVGSDKLTKIYLHVLFQGSYEPIVINSDSTYSVDRTFYDVYNDTSLTTYDDGAASWKVYEITLHDGVNVLQVWNRDLANPSTSLNGLGAIKIVNLNSASNITLPDITFYG